MTMSDQIMVWPLAKDLSLAQLRFHARWVHRLWAGDVKTAAELRKAHATWHAEGFHTSTDGHTDHVHAAVAGLRELEPTRPSPPPSPPPPPPEKGCGDRKSVV